jgi:hypothetical protein
MKVDYTKLSQRDLQALLDKAIDEGRFDILMELAKLLKD